MKNLYCIKTYKDIDMEGVYEPVPKMKVVGYVYATEEEINKFLAKWHKPTADEGLHYEPYFKHIVTAEPMKISDINTLVPYDEDPDEDGNFDWLLYYEYQDLLDENEKDYDEDYEED